MSITKTTLRTYHAPVRVLYGTGIAAGAGTEVAEALPDVARALIVTDVGVQQAGITERLEQSLNAALIATATVTIASEPTEGDVAGGAAVLAEHEADVIVGVGGGPRWTPERRSTSPRTTTATSGPSRGSTSGAKRRAPVRERAHDGGHRLGGRLRHGRLRPRGAAQVPDNRQALLARTGAARSRAHGVATACERLRGPESTRSRKRWARWS